MISPAHHKNPTNAVENSTNLKGMTKKKEKNENELSKGAKKLEIVVAASALVSVVVNALQENAKKPFKLHTE